ncbi:MAG TPA: hypothetical protein VG267_20275 [Terracidiphilus sp.]|jgi:hypothetical protein|nr:hypothetical protein [Terracidiphilus sp.]
MNRLAFGSVLVAFSLGGGRAVAAQQAVLPSHGTARIELTLDVATTTEDGLPAALRFTLRNIGDVPVEIPPPAIDCIVSDGSIRIKAVIHFDGPEGVRRGHGCGGGVSHEPSLLVRIRTEWFHLRPGEYLTFMGDARNMIDRSDKPATYEYWAVYEPPKLTAKELGIVAQNGFVIPSEPVESDSLQFHMP